MDFDEKGSFVSFDFGDEGAEGLEWTQFGSEGVITESDKGLGLEFGDCLKNIESPLICDMGRGKDEAFGECKEGEAVSDVGVKFIKSNESLHNQGLNSSANFKTVACDVLTPTRVVESVGTEGNLFSMGNGNVSNDVTGNSSALKPEFGVSELVWGKVMGHPWWPGQICEPSDSSELARECFKKGSYLIAYFGDHTFAWNDAPRIKPFLEHFSKMEKQSTMAEFQHAVDCALDEISRRVEFGLACSCISEKVYAKLKTQMVINAGIREEASRRDGGDSSLSADSFEPVKLIKFMKEIAQCPYSKANRLEIVKAHAQLSAFCCWTIYSQLPVAEKNDVEFGLLGEKYQCNEVSDDASPIVEGKKLVRTTERKNNTLYQRKDISGDHMNFTKEKKSSSPLKTQHCLISMTEDGSELVVGSGMVSRPSIKEWKERDAKSGEDTYPVIEDDKLLLKSKGKDNSLLKCKHVSGDGMNQSDPEKSVSELNGEKCMFTPMNEDESEWIADDELISQSSSKKRKEVDAIAGEDSLVAIEDDNLVSEIKDKDSSMVKCKHISGDRTTPSEEVKSVSDLKVGKYLCTPVNENESEGKCDGQLFTQTSRKKRKEVDAVADDSTVKHWRSDSSTWTGNNSNEQSLLGMDDFFKVFLQNVHDL